MVSATYNKTDYCEGENCERKKTRWVFFSYYDSVFI
jgi:hypothetical protein